MKNLIMTVVHMGLTKEVYLGFHVLCFVVIFFFYIWRAKKFGIEAKKGIQLVLIVFPFIYLLIYILYWIEAGFTSFGGNNVVRGFVYIPLIAYPLSKLQKMSWKKMCDILAPSVCLAQGIGHFGCIFTGCCSGYPSTWGIYNPASGVVCFPSQPLEAITALIIVAVIVLREEKNNYVVDGLSTPIMLMLFGFTRFAFEFMRDNEKILFGCSSLSFHALFMGIVGLVMYVVIKRSNRGGREVKC